MDLEAFRWLLTDPGRQLLQRAEEAYVDQGGDPLRTTTALRRDVDGEDAAATPASDLDVGGGIGGDLEALAPAG